MKHVIYHKPTAVTIKTTDVPLIRICIYVFVHLWNYSGVEEIGNKLLL